MTVKELYKRLEILMKANPMCKDNEVGVPDLKFRGMGGTPIIKLNSIANGHDWDTGKTFLQFEEQLLKQ